MKVHKKPLVAVDGVFPCNACNQTFLTKKSFRLHVRAKHLNKSPLKCWNCKLEFRGQNTLTRHLIQAHDEHPQFQCDICKKTFYFKAELLVHIRQHAKVTASETYVCDFCGHSFASLHAVNRHRQLHEQDKLNGVNRDDRRRKGIKGHLPCTLCPLSFSRAAPLRDHLKKKHHPNGALVWEQMVPMLCIRCNEIFTSTEQVKEHREAHNQYQCAICKQYLTSSKSLIYHMSTHSNKKRPFKCEVRIHEKHFT